MRQLLPLCLLLFGAIAAAGEIPNPLIDYKAFKANVRKVEKLREQRRLTEEEFMRMAADPHTVILDARSAQRFEWLHIKGARNLNFSDITAAELAKVIPSKSTRVLIYCNNNFLNEPYAFATKVAPASLNLHTFTTLLSYGYTNIYELGPAIDVNQARIPFEGSKHLSAPSQALNTWLPASDARR